MRWLLLVLLLVWPACAQTGDSVLITYDTGTGEWACADGSRADRPYSPCETFDIPNALILLESQTPGAAPVEPTSALYGKYLRDFDYGNQDVTGGVDTPFWQMSSLKVSARQQAHFLKNLEAGELALAPRHQETVRESLLLQRGQGWTLHGKSGSGRTADGTRSVSWFVGWVTRGGRALVFASNLEGPTSQSARELVERWLRQQGWLGPS